MTRNETKLTAKQTRTIEALLFCESTEAAAKKANVAKSTLITSNRPVEDWGKLLGDNVEMTTKN